MIARRKIDIWIPLSLGIIAIVLVLLPSLRDGASTKTISLEVDIVMESNGESTRFLVPRHYLGFAPNRKGGEQTALAISVSLPEIHSEFSDQFLPIIEAAFESGDTPIFHESTRILLVRGRPNVKRLLRQDIKEVALNTGQTVSGLGEYINSNHRIKTPNGFHLRADLIYFLPEETGEEYGLYFQCYAKIFVDRCKGWGNYNEGLYYQYYFSRQNLKHWKVMDANVRALLESFERSASKKNNRDSG